jgi:tetrapyrrole methylase family protein/MazG family protein
MPEATRPGVGTTAADSEALDRTARAYGRLYSIIARLRGPGGCPWDREQTPKSLRSAVLEEAYELVEAIDEEDPLHIAEEIGDSALLASMIAYMHEERGDFSVADAVNGLCDKLIRRHPHVFGDSDVDTPEAVIAQWNEIKVKVEGRRKKDSLVDEVPRSLPPLERAYKLQKKAAKVGFDWSRPREVWAKVREELGEARAAFEALECELKSAEESCDRAAHEKERAALEEELGDLLFGAVNLARFLDVDPAIALSSAVEKFSRRFRHVERRMAELGKALSAENMDLMDGFWEEAKRSERS